MLTAIGVVSCASVTVSVLLVVYLHLTTRTEPVDMSYDGINESSSLPAATPAENWNVFSGIALFAIAIWMGQVWIPQGVALLFSQ